MAIIDKNIRTGKFSRLTGLVCLSVLLSACSGFFDMTSSDAPQPCPPVSTLADASKITRFVSGPGRDLIDIDFIGQISHLSGKCYYEIDSDTGEGLVRVNIKSEFDIERGAANKSHQADFEYFVSILDDNGNILDKQTFSFSAKYWKNRQSVKDSDAPVELSIPLTNGQVGQDFNIYVGFQLTQEELDYNRGIPNR